MQAVVRSHHPIFAHSKKIRCGYGGTGRRARLRILCRKAWGFDSLYPHFFFSLSTVPLFIFILTTPQIRGYTYALICGSFACDLSYICLNYK